MYQSIEFRAGFDVDLEISPKERLERLQIRKGMKVRAELRPYVIESPGGPLEVADVCFEDGTVSRQIPYALFRFVE
jgi:hypothetical protein